MKVGNIFLGVILGCILGTLLGPYAPILKQDNLKIDRFTSKTFYTGPQYSSSEVKLQAGSENVFLEMLNDEQGFTKFKVARGVLISSEMQSNLEIDYVYLPISKIPRLMNPWGDRFVAIMAFLGEAFIRLIKMLVVPIIMISMIVGVSAMGDVRRLGRLGGRLLLYFLCTTIVAISIGVLVTQIIQPGKSLDLKVKEELLQEYQQPQETDIRTQLKGKSLARMALEIIPENPIKAMAEGDLLGVIFFSLFLGITLTLLPKGKGKPVLTILQRINDALLIGVKGIMIIAPIGVGALMAAVVGSTGWGILKALLAYSLVVILGLVLLLAAYAIIIVSISKRSLKEFFKVIRPAQMLAFATSSSAATLPVSLDVAKDGLKLSRRVYNLVLPLGTTINMDGTALYQGVAAVFIAQVFGMDLALGDMVRVVVTATMASIGAAGVPGVGLFTLAMVLESIGVPAIGLALILGPDRILDMFRTATNVTGDLTAATVMERFSGSSGNESSQY